MIIVYLVGLLPQNIAMISIKQRMKISSVTRGEKNMGVISVLMKKGLKQNFLMAQWRMVFPSTNLWEH